MIEFIPTILKEDLLSAIDTLCFMEGDIQGIELKDLKDYDKEDENEEFSIDEQTNICLYIGEDDAQDMEVKNFISLAQNKSKLKINEVQSYARSDREVYYLLDLLDSDAFALLDNTFYALGRPASVLEKCEIVNGKTYKIALFSGFCIFHLLVQESGNFNEYFPSYSPYDVFVKIQCDDVIDMRMADALAEAYVFELQATFDIQLPFSTGRVDTNQVDWSTESLYGKEKMLFPLVMGSGTKELLSLYNTAKTTYDLDFKILGFTKVIEYIAPTIAQKSLIESVTLKLTSSEIFKPTASYISSLGAIYDKSRNISTKDSELIKLSVSTVVTVEDIWEFVPDFINNKQTIIPTEIAEQNALLLKVSESIYNTRNEIAHAKANYEKKGSECPAKYKGDFCKMLDIIAVRCIRWFAMQPEERRVVLE